MRRFFTPLVRWLVSEAKDSQSVASQTLTRWVAVCEDNTILTASQSACGMALYIYSVLCGTLVLGNVLLVQ